MPPVIKPKRAQVSDEAIDWAVAFWKERYAALEKTIRTAPLRQQEELENSYAVALHKLYGALTSPAERDVRITDFRTLPLKAIDIEDVPVSFNDSGTRLSQPETVHYLVAHTKTIVVTDGGPWNMGEYKIYLPPDIGIKGVGTYRFHLVPQDEPRTYARHPHHKLGSDVPQNQHPASVAAHTCWGGFSGMMPRILSEGDLVDLLRNIVIYLTRYDRGSPLTHIENCPHAKSITRREAEVLRGQ